MAKRYRIFSRLIEKMEEGSLVCKECQYFTRSQNGIDGFCNHPSIPFMIAQSEGLCKFERTKLRCKDCKYWESAYGFEPDDDCGGCTFGGGFFPMFRNEPCGLKDEYRKQVENEYNPLKS